MPTVAIELNDAGVTIARQGTLLPESPGYALVDGEQLVVGAEAREQARLQPRHVHSRFWDRLALDPLPRPTPLARTQADLACAHLSQIWGHVREGCDGVVFAVPGSFSHAQLGLLLGIAQSCSMPVAGMVDAAVAATPASESGHNLVHVDLQLHRAVVTGLRFTTSLMRTGVGTNAQAGLASLHDAAVKLIAELFVRHTRFDPLHRARTEQQLYDLLPECLGRLRRDDRVEIRMRAGGKTHGAVLRHDWLLEALGPRYRQIAELIEETREPGEPTLVNLSSRANALPGLADLLGGLSGCEVVVLEPGAAALGALAREAEIRSAEGSVRFVSALGGGRRVVPVRESKPPRERETLRPTHVLHRDVAHRIGTTPLAIGTAIADAEPGIRLAPSSRSAPPGRCAIFLDGSEVRIEDHGESGTLVNDEKVEGTAQLHVGDRIRVSASGEELRLIAVDDERRGREA
ncbi:MAG: hypothetical protein OEM05_02465 [Myxococcales bacterium]|nr:hypothetical protein [Myxococcales bacterium]